MLNTLDADEPIAVPLLSVLMYFTDSRVHHLLGTLLDAVAPGSCLVVSHPTADFDPHAAAQAVAVASRSGLRCHPRTRSEVIALFDDLDLVEPGVVPMLSWRPRSAPLDPHDLFYWAGMARK